MSTSLCWCCFFFSSRRRHTRFDCDWSSDVCSSDLVRGRPTLALGVRDHVQCQRGLTARFGAEDLRYPPPRDAADPDRRVQVDRARRDDLHPHPRRIGPHPHDGALAASLLDLRDGEVEGLSALVRELRDFLFRRHECPRHGLAASFGEARIYTEAPVIATRGGTRRDRKSTRLNSSHSQISYAVFCLKTKSYSTSTRVGCGRLLRTP